jgi:hypothetical protein
MTTIDIESLKEIEHLLPERVQDLIAVLGIDRTLALVQAVGGRRIFMARDMKTAPRVGHLRYQALAEAIGPEATDLLISHYADEYLDVPNCKFHLTWLRNRELRQRYAQGASLWDLGCEFNLSRARIQQILAEGEDAKAAQARQPDLFG